MKETGLSRLDSATAVGLFKAAGYADVEVLGVGMEGLALALGDDLVGKVWFDAALDGLASKRAFYAELSRQELPFETPHIERLEVIDGHVISVERRLPGITMQAALEQGLITIDAALDAFVQIPPSLADTVAGDASAGLRVLDEETPFRRGDESWSAALARLVETRGRRFWTSLRDRVEGFEQKLELTVNGLLAIEGDQQQVVHGDLVPENILVDRAGTVLAVLDWSFLTASGDNTFDAAIGAGIFDMYGEHARTYDDLLLSRLCRDHDYALQRMLLYRAAYAIATANAYSADGSDGHFAWCAANLDRTDVTDALDA